MKKWVFTSGVILWITMIIIPLYILFNYLHPGQPQRDAEIWMPHTVNTTRITGDSPTNLSLKISRIKFPEPGYLKKPHFVIIADNSPVHALPTASLLARPLDTVLFIWEGPGSQDAIISEIRKLSPIGINGYQVILVGKFPEEFIQHFAGEGFGVRIIYDKNPSRLCIELDRLKNQLLGKRSKNILVASSKNLKSLLPGLAWSARTGDSIFILEGSRIPEELRERARKEKNKLKVFYFGKLDQDMEQKLAALGEVEIFAHPDPAVLSARFAAYYSPASGIGWQNRVSAGDSSLNVILTDDTWYHALLGASLNSTDKFGPLLITDTRKLTPAVENYLWSIKPDYWVTPSEGPYNHAWIIGNSISYNVQARVDFINETDSYLTCGKQGLSGLEALLLVHIIMCFLGSLWTALHIRTRKPDMFWDTKIMWPLLVSITGIVGLIVYIASYKNRKPVYMDSGKLAWARPVWNQAAFATASSIAFGASLMLAFAFLWAVRGMPLLTLKGPFFWIGNPMIVQMALSYIFALLINWLVFQSPITSSKKGIPYSLALNQTLLPVFVSMTSVSLGMMPAMWWLQMRYLPSMPEEDTLLWWGTALAALMVGAVLAFIANWEMVRLNLKEGNG